MNTPVPGLRPLYHDSSGDVRVQIVVGPGDVLAVSDDVAEQLKAASPQFKDAAPEPEPEVEAKPRKRRSKGTSA